MQREGWAQQGQQQQAGFKQQEKMFTMQDVAEAKRLQEQMKWQESMAQKEWEAKSGLAKTLARKQQQSTIWGGLLSLLPATLASPVVGGLGGANAIGSMFSSLFGGQQSGSSGGFGYSQLPNIFQQRSQQAGSH